MIKAVAGPPEHPAVILGLSRENVERLLAGRPIPVKLRELRPALPALDVVLLGGETEADIMEDLCALAPIRPEQAAS